MTMKKGDVITLSPQILDGPAVASQLLLLPDRPMVLSPAQKEIS
jgi:hypothetical protein